MSSQREKHGRTISVATIILVILAFTLGFTGGATTFNNQLQTVLASNVPLHEESEVRSVRLANLATELQIVKQSNLELGARNELRAADAESLALRIEELKKQNTAMISQSTQTEAQEERVSDVLALRNHINRDIQLLTIMMQPLPDTRAGLQLWRNSMVDRTAQANPELVGTALTLTDRWIEIVEWEESEPIEEDVYSRAAVDWSLQWEVRVLKYLDVQTKFLNLLNGQIHADLSELDSKIALLGTK